MSDETETIDGKLWTNADGDRALQQYHALLASFADGLYQIDADGRFVTINDGFAESVGYDRSDLLDGDLSLVLNDPDFARFKESINVLHERGVNELSVEIPLLTANGETIACEHRLTLCPTREGNDSQVVAGAVRVRDGGDGVGITPSDHTLAGVLDEADIGVFVLNEEFEVVWIDESIERYFGVDREAAVGRNKRQLVEETIAERVADGETFKETIFATYDDNTYLEQFECRVTTSDDREERWLEHRSKPIESGPYTGGRVELYYDVTEQRHSENARRQSEENFETLADTIEEYAIFRLDSEGHVISWNEGAREIKGYDADEILGEHFSTFYTEQDRAEGVPERNFERAAEQGSVEDEGWRVRADGTRFWANVTITAVRDDGGTPHGYLKVTRDMTDRYEREQALKGELERVFDRISDAFYAVDEDFRFTHVNERAEELLQASEEELLGKKLWDVFPDAAEIDEVLEAFETALDEQEPTSYERYYDRLDFWVEANLYPSETGISVYFRDVTERKTRERELKQRARQQEAVADIGQFALETDDLDELMHEATRRVAEALDNEYCKVLDSDEQELLLRQGVGWRDGIVGEATVSSVKADSQAAYILANDHPIVVEDIETETRFSAPELLTSHDVRSGISTIIGSIDEPWGILGAHDTERREFTDEDVTFVQSVANVLAEAIQRHQYQEELERLVTELEESNERLEQFAYAASHDLQEPLRMVSSYLQLIERRYGEEFDEDVKEFLEYAVDGADRMREMINGLLEYSRVETRGDPLEPVDLHEVFEDVLDDLRLQIEDSDAEITVEDLPTVEGDASQLRQVFQNLLDNAIKYRGDERPQITVTAKRSGSEWIVSVEDEGIGIDTDNQDQIFEVFRQLHTQDEHTGTGIGLALCERIVERHGSEIWIESKPGEGSAFFFTLSAVESPPQADN